VTGRWKVRLIAAPAACALLAVGLGIRWLAGSGTGAVAQYSGTALYASMVYAGVFVLVPTTRAWAAGAAAIGFCWIVELFQLTGVPAQLSSHSLLARLVLGVQFDTTDLAWYVAGVLPLVIIQSSRRVWRSARGSTSDQPA